MALLVLYRGRTRVCNLLDSTFNTNSPLKASKTPRISNILGLVRLGLIPVLIVLIPYDSGINPDQYPKLGNIAKPAFSFHSVDLYLPTSVYPHSNHQSSALVTTTSMAHTTIKLQSVKIPNAGSNLVESLVPAIYGLLGASWRRLRPTLRMVRQA